MASVDDVPLVPENDQFSEDDDDINQQEKRCRCLVCGCITNFLCDERGRRIRVKREFEGEKGDDEDQDDESDGFNLNSNSNDLQKGGLEWEIDLFESFFKAMKSKPKTPKYEWNFEEEPLPFCYACEGEIESLRKLLEEIEKLERLVGNTVKELKDKMVAAEESFQTEDVYKEDGRYYWVRANVIGKGRVGPAPGLLQSRSKKRDLDMDGDEPRRKSSRFIPSQLHVSLNEVSQTDSNKGVEQENDKLQNTITDETEIKLEELDNGRDSDYQETLNCDFTISSPSPCPASISSPRERRVSSDLRPKSSLPDTNVKRKKRKRGSINEKKELKSGEAEVTIRQKRKRESTKKVVYKDDLSDSEDSPLPPTPPPRKRKITKKADGKVVKRSQKDDDYVPEESHEKYVADSGESETEQYELAESEFSDDGEGEIVHQCDTDIINGKKVKGVCYLPETGHIRYANHRSVNFISTGKNKEFKCSKCDEIVTTQREVKEHVLRSHTGINKCNFPGCKFRGISKIAVRSHYQQAHKSNKSTEELSCEICGKPGKKSHLRVHIVSHMNAEERLEADARGEIEAWKRQYCVVGPFSCDQCKEIFKSRYLLDNHKKKAHPQDSEEQETPELLIHLCSFCGKTFSQHKALRRHLRRVHPKDGDQPYACVYCNKRFVNQKSLREHKIVHTGERPFHCDHPNCARQFPTQKKLDKHKLSHAAMRPFVCTACPASFLNPYHLKRHFDTYHTPGSNPKRKSYIRGPDKAAFRVQNTWENALRPETEADRPHRCTSCKGAFTSAYNLKRHHQIYHAPGGKNYIPPPNESQQQETDETPSSATQVPAADVKDGVEVHNLLTSSIGHPNPQLSTTSVSGGVNILSGQISEFPQDLSLVRYGSYFI